MKKYLSIALLMSTLVLSTAFNTKTQQDLPSMPEDEPIAITPGEAAPYPALHRRYMAGDEDMMPMRTRALRGKAEFSTPAERLQWRLERLSDRLRTASPAEKRRIKMKIRALKARLAHAGSQMRQRRQRGHEGRPGRWQLDVSRASVRPY